jgi:Cys-rich repeat protein
MRGPPLALSVTLALPTLASFACGTEEWSFYDTVASQMPEASLDAGGVDAVVDASDASDSGPEAGAPGARPQCRSNQDCQYVRSGPICAPDGECVPECSSDRSCPNSRPHCDRPIGRCVRCLNDDDCPAGDVCSTHSCVPARDP